MTIFLLFVMIAVMLAIDLARRSERRELSQSVKPDGVGGESILGQRFFHPGHSWMTVDSVEEVTVGADEFAQSVVGTLSAVKLPELGKTFRQGEVLALFERGDKTLPHIAPVSGTVVQVNPRLGRNPGLINSSPLDKGWTVKIAPWNLRLELGNLMRDLSAERWQRAVKDQFVQWFSGSHALALQDGGSLMQNVCDQLSKEEWNRVVEDFFPTAHNYTTDQKD
jgi:glycine cleavage system H lipoate-binding protein